jgi:protocatechuate 3,4-dioxygenase beta subunit
VPRHHTAALLVLPLLATTASADIDGRVFDTEGRSLAGASAVAYGAETSAARAERLLAGRPRAPLATARSAADGTFRLTTGAGLVDVQVHAEGFAPTQTATVDGDPVMLGLTRAGVERGLVTAKGRPVAGATVVWMGGEVLAEASGEVIVMTAADGSYEVPDPEAWASRVLVLHAGAATLDVSRGQGSGRLALRHELQAGVDVAGSVVDEASGRAVGGVPLWIGDWPLGRSGADGSFLIRYAPADWTAVSARGRHAGITPRTAGRIVVRTRPARSLSGVVRDAQTRRALGGAVVRVFSERREFVTAITDAQGRYTFDSLPSMRYVPQAYRPSHAEADTPNREADVIDLRNAPTATRDVLLAPLARLRGHVRDEEGKPVDAALVTAAVADTPSLYADWGSVGQGAWTKTSPDGAFILLVAADEAKTPVVVLKEGFAAARAEANGSPTITLVKGVLVQGRVRDPDGRPIPGVAIALGEEGSFTGSQVRALLENFQGDGWVRSDADGQFRTHVHPLPHSLAFHKAGHTPRLVRGHDPRSGHALEVILDPAAEIRGRVFRRGGAGVADLQVWAQQPGGARTATGHTDSDGTFRLADLVPGVYQLSVVDPSGGVQSRTVEAPSADMQIQLDPTGHVRGRVMDARTQAPVRSFQARAVPTRQVPGRAAAGPQTFDDPAGTFVIGDLPVGEVSLTVHAEGYVAASLEATVSVDGEAAETVFTLEPGARIRGRVTNEEGTAVPDAWVRAPGDDRVAVVQTGESGDYELQGLPPGELKLEFGKQGFRTARRTVSAGEGARVDVTLSRGLALSGTVIRDGVGLAGARVSATSAVTEADSGSAAADAAGKFRIEGLSSGRYTVRAQSDEGESTEAHDVDVETAGPLRLVIERPPTAVLTGRVAGLAPDDAGYVWVRAEGDEGRSAQETVDAQGEFRMDRAPAGTVRVHALSVSMSGVARSSRTKEIILPPGAQGKVVLEFSDDFRVTGTVSADGAPVAGATVHWSLAGGGGGSQMSRTGQDGRYEVLGLDPGAYVVNVSADAMTTHLQHVVSADDRLDIDTTGAEVSGRTVQTDGTPLGGVDVSLWRLDARANTPVASVNSGAGGAFSVRWVKDGRYRLIGAKEGFGQDVHEVDLARGPTSELLLRLQPADALQVAVVDARDGRPLDATVVVRDPGRKIVARTHSRVDADGSFKISLAPGAYLLSASAAGYGTATLPVTAPGAGPRVGLTPGGTLLVESVRDLRGRLRLVRPDGEEYVRCVCNGIADIEVKGRRTRIPNVTPGSYSVDFVDTRGTSVPAPPVLIREGQLTTVSIE